MRIKLFALVILSVLFFSSTAIQWYEKGHTAFLTWKNFDKAVQKPGKFKFVKFFTHNCKYCRMLKQVEQELMKQQKWSFEFYNVDCTKHYDLCQEKASPKAYPYVEIYGLSGTKDAHISGFYPIDVMRDIFKNISIAQENALKMNNKKAEVKQKKEEPTKTTKIIAPSEDLKQPIIEKKEQQSIKVPEKVETKEPIKDNSPQSQSDNDSSSVTLGIKIMIVLFGVWMFNKQVQPVLDKETQPSENMSKQIEIPIACSSQYSRVKDIQEGSSFMSDTL